LYFILILENDLSILLHIERPMVFLFFLKYVHCTTTSRVWHRRCWYAVDILGIGVQYNNV